MKACLVILFALAAICSAEEPVRKDIRGYPYVPIQYPIGMQYDVPNIYKYPGGVPLPLTSVRGIYPSRVSPLGLPLPAVQAPFVQAPVVPIVN